MLTFRQLIYLLGKIVPVLEALCSFVLQIYDSDAVDEAFSSQIHRSQGRPGIEFQYNDRVNIMKQLNNQPTLVLQTSLGLLMCDWRMLL